jgi:hypothetical protein
MSKFLKCTTLITFIFLVFGFSLYHVRASILVPAVQKYICKKTGCEVKFNNFYILPFSLTFVDVNVDDSIFARKVIFKLNPIVFFKNINSHINFVNQINISKLKVSLNKGGENILFGRKNIALKSHKFMGTIFIDEAVIKKDGKLLKIINSNIYVDSQKITLGSTLYMSNVPIKFCSCIKRKTDNIFTSSSIFISKNKVNLFLKAVGVINLSSFGTVQNIKIEKFVYKGFKLDGSSAVFFMDRNSYSMSLLGKFGEFELKSLQKGVVEANSKIDISKVNKKMKGSIKLNFRHENEKSLLKLKTENLGISGINFKNFVLLGLRDKDNVCNISCIYELGKKIKIRLIKSADYKMEFFARNKILGTVNGNMVTGKIMANIKNVNSRDLPIISILNKSIEWIINISGEIGESFGQIDFTFKKLNKEDFAGRKNIIGTINRNRNKYIFSFYKVDGSIVFNSIVEDGKIVSAGFKFINLSILDTLNTFGCFKHDISGSASGYIKYYKSASTKFYIEGFNGTLFNNNFKIIELKGDVSLNKVNLERFVIKNESNRVLAYASGIFNFASTFPISFFKINFENMNIGKVILNGNAEFHGCLKNRNKIKGTIKSTCGFVVSGVHFGNVSSDVIISKRDINFSNLNSDNGLRGSLSIDFTTSNIAGNIYLKNTNIRGAYRGLYGFLNSEINFSGELNNPNIKIKTFLRRGSYFLLHFTLVLESEYRNRVFEVSKAVMLTDNTKIIFNMRYLKDNILCVTIENLTEKVVNALVGFRIPIKGNFSGKAMITTSKAGEKQSFKMFLKSKNVYVGNVKLNDVKSKIEIINGNIIISDVSAKFLNGEMKISKGFLKVKNGEYTLNLFLGNIQIGSIDLFGRIKLSGRLVSGKHTSVTHVGRVDSCNLWINKYKLSAFQITYIIRGKKLEFLQKYIPKNLRSFSEVVVLSTPILIEKNSIIKNKFSLSLRANFLGDSPNLRVEISSIPLDFLANILRVPNVIKGYANINIDLLCGISKPEGSISIASTNGSILEIPYDNLDVKMVFSDNYAHIKKATVFKRSEFRAFAVGGLPICLGRAISVKTHNKPINILYEVEDYKLNIFKYLTKGYIKPHFGMMLFKGSCTGTYGEVKNNGKILMTGGSFDLKDYIGRVKDMFVEMSIIENLVEINKFSFKSGSSKLSVFGSLTLDNFSIRDFNLRFFTEKKGVFIRIPQLPISKSLRLIKNYSSGKPRFDIRLQGTPDKPKISGYVLLENTRFTFPWNIDKTDTFSFIPKNTEFDLKIKSAKNTRFENSFVSALISGFVHFGGYYNDLKISGIIETSKGNVDYFGCEFFITSALVEIIDEEQIYITAKGETTIPSTSRYGFKKLRFNIERSKMSNLSLSILKFSPNGSLIDFDMYSKRNFEEYTKIEFNNRDLIDIKIKDISNFTMRQQSSYLVNRVFAVIAKAILTKTGMIDDLRVSHVNTNPDLPSAEGYKLGNWLLGTKYSFEKNLTDKILFGYSITLDKSRKYVDKFDLKFCHAVELEYKFTDNLFLSVTYEFTSDKTDYKLGNKIMLKNQICFGGGRLQREK